MCKIDNIERPNYGEDYVKMGAKDFRINGMCRTRNKEDADNCIGHDHIWGDCCYYNIHSGKCMRSDNKDMMDKVLELNDPGVPRS